MKIAVSRAQLPDGPLEYMTTLEARFPQAPQGGVVLRIEVYAVGDTYYLETDLGGLSPVQRAWVQVRDAMVGEHMIALTRHYVGAQIRYIEACRRALERGAEPPPPPDPGVTH